LRQPVVYQEPTPSPPQGKEFGIAQNGQCVPKVKMYETRIFLHSSFAGWVDFL
jgi:hypothetical protein